jgi:hypothetical protein
MPVALLPVVLFIGCANSCFVAIQPTERNDRHRGEHNSTLGPASRTSNQAI